MQEKNYVQMLIQSLEKKTVILNRIIELNEVQTQVLLQDEVNMEEFNLTVEQKAQEIDKINFLDEGFEEVYERVKESLDKNRQAFAGEISRLQELVASITERSIKIKTEEERNKELAQKQFACLKKQVRNMQQNNRIAEKYRTNMQQLNVVDAQFLDKKN